MAGKSRSKTVVKGTTDAATDVNPDPITGAPGSHPVGTGLGAGVGGTLGAMAGAAATGAAVGTAAGPIGVAAGIAIGAVAGGLAGKGIAEHVDPTAEEAYWRDEYKNRDYYQEDVDYDEIAPAYRYGWEARSEYPDREWRDAEADLARGWSDQRGTSSLDWERAQAATRDAWERIEANSRRRPR